MQDSPPETPVRATRVPQPRRTESDRIRITTPDAAVPQTGDDREALLRQQLAQMQQQIATLTNQIASQTAPAPAAVQVRQQQHLSREYWALPIDKSIKYPGEDATNNAKTAYIQRLDAYIAKSAPIHELLSGARPCPITTDDEAMAALTDTFGTLWKFEPKDIDRSLALLQRGSPDAYARVLQMLNDGSTTPHGSWSQRNAALYTVVCDTLDLSKNGKDLDFLEVVKANNGLAIYNLIRFRLREIKSLDPLARAIKLQMGLQHIKYVPQPHGVAKYLAKIESHRTELASLPRPKIIDDWEVTAKILRELPTLHPQFKAAADILAVQRKILKTETTLEDCRKAFISADVDNDIGADLHSRNSAKSKRKIRANLSQTDKRNKSGHVGNRNSGRFKYGDCVHHPKSNTHLTRQCTNPFGLRSAFGLAVSYSDKCVAVKASVAAGWSPSATNVRVPQGYGCDGPNMNVNNKLPTQPHGRFPARAPIHANATTMPNAGLHFHPHELRAYQRVSAIMHNDFARPALPPTPTTGPVPLAPPVGYAPLYPTTQHAVGSPIRAFHAAPAHGSPQRPSHFPPHPVYHQPQLLPRQLFPTSTHVQPPSHLPALTNANTSSLQHGQIPQPTHEDLIAAGMRYYATQAGMQDFQ